MFYFGVWSTSSAPGRIYYKFNFYLNDLCVLQIITFRPSYDIH